MASKPINGKNSSNNNGEDDIIWPESDLELRRKLSSVGEIELGLEKPDEEFDELGETSESMSSEKDNELNLRKVFYLSGESPEAFRQSLIEAREGEGLKPVNMARRMGIDQSNYSRIERKGSNFPLQKTIRDLAYALQGEIVITYPPETVRPEY